jgi:uncharacterized protein (TIRG00374 family)
MPIKLIQFIRDNKGLNTTLKVLTGIILFVIILSQVDYHKLLAALKNCNLSYLFFGFFAFGCSRFAEGVRLFILLYKHAFRFWSAIKLVIVSTFFNNVATTIAGDGYRIYSINSNVQNLNQSLSIIFFERSIGFLVIIIIGLTYTLFYYDKLLLNISSISFQYHIAFNLFLIFILLAILGASFIIIRKRYYHLIFQQLHLFLENLLSTFTSLSFVESFWIVGLSLVSQILIACKIYLLILAFNHMIPFFDTLFIAVFIFIISFIPLSIGSLGLREGALVTALVLYDVPVSEAIAISLIARAIMYAWALIGGILYLSSRLKIVA